MPTGILPPYASWHDLRLLVAEDIRVTGIQDGHGGATEELTASGAQLDLWRVKSKHAIGYPPKSVTRLLLWVDQET